MIRAERCQPADVMHLLDGIQSAKTDRNGVIDMAALVRRGEVFRVLDGAQTVAAYVLEPRGALLWVSAFGGSAAFDLTAALAALLEQQGRAFDEIGFRTERRGLVSKTRRLGYHVLRQDGAAYYMRKKLQ